MKDYLSNENYTSADIIRARELELEVSECRKRLQDNPEDEDAMFTLGQALEKHGRFDEAIEVYSGIQAGSEYFNRVLLSMARSFRLAACPSHALIIVNAAIKSDALCYDAYSERSYVHHDMRKPELAIQDLDIYAEFTRESAARLSRRGGLLVEAGKMDQARDHFYRALELDPSDPEANGCLGCLFMVRGEYEEAARFFGAVQVYPYDMADNLLFSAECLKRLGREEEARGEIDKALKINPNILAEYELMEDELGPILSELVGVSRSANIKGESRKPE